jgi:hypothetical protein
MTPGRASDVPPVRVKNYVDLWLHAPYRRDVEFCGRTRVHVQRLAVSWWDAHRRELGLCLKEFFLCCKLSDDERTIIFTQP